MSVVTRISGNQIKNLITKFYYKENHLCFQILLDLDEEEFVSHSEYIDYAAYKQAFEELISIKSNNTPFELGQIEFEETNMDLA